MSVSGFRLRIADCKGSAWRLAMCATARRRHRALPLLITFLTLYAHRAHALVTYDNAQNDPSHNTTTAGMPSGLEAMWDSVVFVEPSPFAYNASAVYLGNGFFLTAWHVDAIKPGQAKVAINRVSYDVDTTFGTGGVLNVQDMPGVVGPVDLKIFRVFSPPSLPPVTLNRNNTENGRDAYLIGCGRGKGTAVAGYGWLVNSDATRAKRWGFSSITQQGTMDPFGSYLMSPFSAAYGNNAASGAQGDSGSGMFQSLDGAWVLSGITVAVTDNTRSYYAPPPDSTLYVRISTYADVILSVIAETAAGTVNVPNLWLGTHYPAAPFSSYPALVAQTAANGVNTVAECYVAGLNPTHAASRFSASITLTNGTPHISWSPDLGTERTYHVLGKADLSESNWNPTNNATRFFKVQVEM